MSTGQQPDHDELSYFVHDLKAPLSAIRGFIELIQHGGLTEIQMRYANRAMGGIDRVVRLIEDWLVLNDVEDQDIHHAEVNLHDLFEEIILMIESDILAREVIVSNHVDPHLQVIGDYGMLLRALTNLVSNGVKYNRVGGTLSIRSSVVDKMVQLTVQDTGIGIQPRALDKIFDRFYREQRRIPGIQDVTGSGLGLSFVKLVAERHGGSIQVDSVVDEGSMFTISLPLPRQKTPKWDQISMASRLPGHDAPREPLDDMDDNLQELPDSDDRESNSDFT